MPHLVPFRLQIIYVIFIWCNYDGHPIDDFYTVPFETDDFLGVVGHQTHFLHSQINQDLGADTIIPWRSSLKPSSMFASTVSLPCS